MKAFWRAQPLTLDEQDLLYALFEAHRLSVFRDNPSAIALKMAMLGSGDYFKAIGAALNTFGGPHGPIVPAMRFLQEETPWRAAALIAHMQGKVVGWGNSFVKGKPDPLWTKVEMSPVLEETGLAAKLRRVTEALHRVGKNIFPNPSAYTAATAIALKIPEALAPWLLVRGRLDGWTDMLGKELRLWA